MLGVAWVGRRPTLRRADGGGVVHEFPLTAGAFSFSVRAAGPFCVGHFTPRENGPRLYVPCPHTRVVPQGRQCPECAAADPSRFMHHAHSGGYVPESMLASLNRPHWLYVATFADGSSKVGTAVDTRKTERLDEQGALLATYLTQTSDGYAVRQLEDAVTEEVGIPQTKHHGAKVNSLMKPHPFHILAQAHDDAVAEASAVLTARSVRVLSERWQAPRLHEAFARRSTYAAYPHRLDGGDHCVTVQALVGDVGLVTVNNDDEPLVLDFSQLRGRVVTPGDVRSPQTLSQASLF